MSEKTFLWYDYESFGISPAFDRPSQFAAVRTDEELNVIGDPVLLYCKPANDFLPSPDACLVTGILPQEADEKGVLEVDFFKEIQKQVGVSGTCSVGYNSIQFDSELTRYGFYRNFIDPYEHEWKNGNSRWDLLDVMRVLHAFRPDAFVWPSIDGKVTMKLDQLTKANGISHEGAHDALSDTMALIELARQVKAKEPKLFNYMLGMRDKKKVSELLEIGTSVLHVSRAYGVDRCCMAMVVPLCINPNNKNSVICYDLSNDPELLFTLDEEEIRKRVFGKKEELGEGVTRIPLVSIQINKVPALIPTRMLDANIEKRTGIDRDACEKHRLMIMGHAEFKEMVAKVTAVFGQPEFSSDDPDGMLYSGFISNYDRTIVKKVASSKPEELSALSGRFNDKRLPELLFRYRAKNFPETLTADELCLWEKYRIERINKYQPNFLERIESMLSTEGVGDRGIYVLSRLKDYYQRVTEKHLTKFRVADIEMHDSINGVIL